MKWKIAYYNQKVADSLEYWPVKMRAKFLRTIDLIEVHGPKLGSSFTKPLTNGLFEIRVKAQEGIPRAFFCYYLKHEIIILHTFIKKTQKTPKKELLIATQRMKEVTL